MPPTSAEEIEGEYELQTGRVIAERFSSLDPLHTPGVLVANHGPFTWGKTAGEAVYNSVVVEEVAKMGFICHSLNPRMPMNAGLIEKHFERKHGVNAYYGQKKR